MSNGVFLSQEALSLLCPILDTRRRNNIGTMVDIKRVDWGEHPELVRENWVSFDQIGSPEPLRTEDDLRAYFAKQGIPLEGCTVGYRGCEKRAAGTEHHHWQINKDLPDVPYTGQNRMQVRFTDL
jgi:hypothetical protein